MLYYTPQIWCSDNTDAVERLQIQYGTSFGYPVSTMGAHVSAVPNHQTGRMTPLSTRSCVAMAGTFGYELDVNRMTEEEKDEVRGQIEMFKKHYDLIQYGEYYRLSSPVEGSATVWEMVSPDGGEALVSAVYHHVRSNPMPVYVKPGGLREDCMYSLELAGVPEERTLPVIGKEHPFKQGQMISGAALMHCGLMIPEALNGFQAWQIYLRAQQNLS